METEMEAAQAKLADADLYKKDPKAYQQATDDIERLGNQTLEAMARWEELEG